MISELTRDLKNLGENSEDAVSRDVACADIGDVVQTINEYDVVADPEKERYMVSDGEHQYSVRIQHADLGKEGQVAVYLEEADTGFSKDILEEGGVMNSDEILEDPGDGAIYGDRSEALVRSAERAPSKGERGF